MFYRVINKHFASLYLCDFAFRLLYFALWGQFQKSDSSVPELQRSSPVYQEYQIYGISFRKRMERGFTQIKRIFTDLKLTSSIDLIENQNACILSYPFFIRPISPNPRPISFETLKLTHPNVIEP